MTLDPYALCPGGTGKKLKFCCADLLHELEKVQRMVEGDQHVAGLDYVTKLTAKYPGRACLLTYRAELEMALGKVAEAGATAAELLAVHPDNPLGLAHLALAKASSPEPLTALEPLERALEVCGHEVPESLYLAIGTIAQALLQAGEIPPAHGLMTWQAMVSGGDDQEAMVQLAEFQRLEWLPLVLRQPLELVPAPKGAPWKYEFDKALEPAQHGNWRLAAQKFAALDSIGRIVACAVAQPGDAAKLVGRLRRSGRSAPQAGRARRAARRGRRGRSASSGHRRSARHRHGVEHPAESGDQLDVTFDVANQEALVERLAADRQVVAASVDPQAYRRYLQQMGGGEEAANQPPPRTVYTLLDPPKLPPDEQLAALDLTAEQIPVVIGRASLFGRQTDRRERLELTVSRHDLPAARELLQRIAGDSFGASEPERVMGQVPPDDWVLNCAGN